ncbi:sulfate adenylyltransferase subunit CysN [Terricaulis sp.]|uniref:sulfate adenylyltransferase subunit CysN n=1 Tax=Terricaulis sp. TaxID=2768686 RepID=UPI003784B4A7
MSSEKGLLRFITCGSVDDGKSTLIGRLLFDCGAVAEDQRAALEADSRAFASGGLDFSLLVDGLTAEREQGITIDVAYRYFTTPKRKFIVADTPGHEQYTRNMVTGASTADVALILVDARKGVLTQTRRHAFLASLMQVRQVALVVTKMDLIGYDEAAFEKISADFATFAQPLKFASVTAIPASGVKGDNIATRGAGTPWYKGPTLLEYLETAEVDDARAAAQPFRMAVQYVNRPNQDFRGFAGRISGGAIAPGDAVRVLPSGRNAKIARIVTADGDLERAIAGQSVTLTFTEEIDCSRGDVIAAAGNPCEIADQFQCTLIWMSDTPLYPGRRYSLKLGARTINATVTDIRHRIDIETLAERPAKQLKPNEIGSCNISLDAPIPFDAFDDNRDTGGFILIDQVTHETAGAGLIRFALRRSHNIHWQSLEIDRNAHAAIKGQKPAIVWFTGLSGAGKSTIANLVEKKLYSLGRHTVLLDGDNLRHGLNRDLGFTSADRVENLRRVGEVAKLMADAGLIVLVAFISPFRQERELARNLAEPGEFFEIYVDAPLDVLEMRDPKGLYKKARAGELANFTGISSPYEPPEAPELRVDTTKLSAAEAAETIVAMLMAR